MKTAIYATMLLAASSGFSFASGQSSTEQREEIRMRSVLYSADYDSMMALVQKKEFAKAFPEIMRFARYGEKYAQYLAGMLLVSGEAGTANVEEGLVWLKLALEQQTSDWERRYEDITKNLSAEQLDSLKPMYDEYLRKYGAENQFMHCGFEKMRGSNMRHHVCRKNLLMNEYYMVVEYK